MTVNKKSGQGTLEILIALAILTLAMSAIVVVSFGNQSISADTENANHALYLAGENLETAKADSKNAFSGVVSNTSMSGIYTKDLIVEDIDSIRKKVTSRVTWSTDPLRNQKVELVTIVSDPASIFTTGGDPGCGGGIAGDWLNPTVTGSLDLGAGISASGLDVLNKIVYMSGNASSIAKSDFFIVDATNPNNLNVLSELEVGSKGINGLDVAGEYVYAANDNVLGQLLVIDISNNILPTLTSSFLLPDVSGTDAVGNSIFYYDSKVYIGTKNTAGPEFHIVDVSNPLAPESLGSREIGGDVNAIVVSDDTAYIATSVDGGEIKILNVLNPTNIMQIGSHDLEDNDDAKSLYLFDNTLLTGKLGGEEELAFLNVLNPASVVEEGTTDISANVNGIVARSDLSIIATSDTTDDFQVWNTGDPSNMTLRKSINLPNIGIGIDCEDDIVYFGLRSNDSLRVITSN